jgi:hypothetical protein
MTSFVNMFLLLATARAEPIYRAQVAVSCLQPAGAVVATAAVVQVADIKVLLLKIIS